MPQGLRALVAILVVAAPLLVATPAADPSAVPGPIAFEEVSAAAGIDFVHDDGSSGRRYIVETVSAGVATFDYDSDGRIDIYFPNGTLLPGAEASEPFRTPRAALYRNLGDWRFEDVTVAAGLDGAAYGVGVTVGDVDDDGLPDIYLSTFGAKRLYRNNGDGTFRDDTSAAGVGDGDKLGAGVAMLDIDADGDLDIYAANYVRFSFDNHLSPRLRGVPLYHGPRDYEAWPDSLFRNEGDGRFVDISADSGIATVTGPGMGVVCLDEDDDGDSDIFVLNDVAANFLFRNDGRGRFEEVALGAGLAYDMFGQPNGSMGVDCGDVDNDGWLDLWMTSYQGERPVLYRNLAGSGFEDITSQSSAAAGSVPWVKWGAGIIDFDNDGLRDLFLACGHINDTVEQFDDSTAYRNHNILLRNTGGKFVNLSAEAGLEAVPRRSARGAAFDDLDNDGDIDVVVLNSREAATVLRNLDRERRGVNHWLGVRLVGTLGNRDGVGAKVSLTLSDRTLVDEVHSGRGYQGHFGSRLHFGLGQSAAVDRLEVRWIGGQSEEFVVSAVDRVLTLRQGNGRHLSPAEE
ncbi:MAG: CRTAC1 family protein [Planctomycetota bacterium]|nr:MAG: CRTAC1 family protein [Planctomycetota bacterium]